MLPDSRQPLVPGAWPSHPPDSVRLATLGNALILALASSVVSGCVINAEDDDDGPSEMVMNGTTSSDVGSGTAAGETAATATSTGLTSTTVSSSGGVTSTDSSGTDPDGTSTGGATEYPAYAGEGTLRLLADGVDLPGHESLAADVNATESSLEVAALRAAAYFDDSGNRVILRLPAAGSAEYGITDVDGGGAVVDVLLNTDATGLEQRIEGPLASGTLRLDELDAESGRVRAVWVGVMTPSSGSGVAEELAVSGALDVTLTVLP